ncbi:MAG: hypothetical protein IKE52_05420 [Mogibacterium sp.]|nr:hypothetical protein [Mogibacterium sp.]
MKKIFQIITACIFIFLMTATGAATLYNSRAVIKGFAKERPKDGYRTAVEGMILDNFAEKTEWININGLFHRLMGTTIVRDNDYIVYKLSNGQIIYDLPKRDMTKHAARVKALDEAVRDMGIEFMYVQLPFKAKDDSYMPLGTHGNGNENADQMVSLLREQGVNTLDIRELFEEQGRDWTEQFYNTDHHWRETTAFWAAGEIMKKMKNDMGVDYSEEYYDEDSYELIRYDNYMLGAVGRRTGKFYAGLDDFVLFKPKYDTDFVFKARGNKKKDSLERSGSFYDTMYIWENLEKRADFDRNTYSTYTGKNFSRIDITNKKANNGLRILIVRESFTCALLPFIAVNAEHVTTVDLRHYKDKSIPELCEEVKPDIVLVNYNPSAFGKEQFNFFNEI